ncbi:MAG: 3-hydroxyacyl-CoA dehydrogenase/enoyl-CoA hydratase family protein, partial [Rhodospirillales bacterium]|nr:3-hydroxyacyl-CoA dehydrogenase/enoyl-CoA hydratase family protein [Rhodospirillales bacterium]
MDDIRKVAVIGAGVMGAGIAAHVANAGVPVVLLDIVPEGAKNRNAIAEGAVAKLLKADPAPFMHKGAAKLVTTGNTEDHLDLLGECDWIVEAVIENLEIKQDLYKRIEAKRKKGSIVSSNTSTIPLHDLTKDLPDSFAKDFLVTHFFNPPRYMRLLELVAGAKTRPDAVETMRRFGDVMLGKGVVDCKDTPGFIANRIGTFWIQCSVSEAFTGGLTVEEADAVIGKPMGIPKTGVFGLMDLVGIDLMPHVASSMLRTLPENDGYRAIYREFDLIKKMITDGYTGRKGKGGFYRINRDGGKKVKESISLQTGDYAPSEKARLESVSASRKGGLRALVEHPDKGGQYAWSVLGQTLAYTAALVPEIADDIHAVDEGMKLGYAWKYGPFELIDRLGPKWFAEKLAAEGKPVPELLTKVGDGTFYRVHEGKPQVFGTDGAYHDIVRPEGVLLLSDIKLRSEPVAKNGSASLWDIGDGVLCLEFHTKMNSIDAGIMTMIGTALKTVPKGGYKALVVHNEGSNFSVGANVGLALFVANIAAWPEVENMIGQGQQTYKALKYAPFPVVGAPSGMALGGGCEILLHCDSIQAHAETYTGLVEVGVGVIPGWGGCKEMLLRWTKNPKGPQGPMAGVGKVFEMVSTAYVAKSAAEAKAALIIRPDDGITMNRDRLLADAKARALALAEGYKPPEEPEIVLPGPTGETAMGMAVDDFRRSGMATPHDVTVSKALARVLAGGDTDITDVMSEDDVLTLE